MYIQLRVKPYSIEESSIQTVGQDNPLYGFPVCRIDRDSYVVDASISTSFLAHNGFIPYNFQIGKSTSIGPDITFLIDSNHDYLAPCQGAIKLIDQPASTERNLLRKGELIIENDCWIGRGATIMSGLTIRNGAIVAANAVVTKDVPPYAIVAGNPAKIVKYRFSQEIIEQLLRIKWWDWSPEQIVEAGQDLRGDINTFVEKYSSAEQPEKNSFNKMRICQENKQYILFVDDAFHLKQFKYCLDEFCHAFEHQNVELMVCIPCDRDELVDAVTDIMNSYDEYEVYVNLLAFEASDVEQIIAQGDAYITNSSKDNISRMDIAYSYELGVISGFNLPMMWE